MKKKLVAILATIAAVFGFGFAANSAMAADNNYGVTGAGTVSGTTATFTFKNLTPGKNYVVSYDDTNVEHVTLAATKYSNVAAAHADGTLTATYTIKAGFAGTISSSVFAVDAAGNPTGSPLATASVTVAATGEGSASNAASSNTVAQTGAAVLPFAVVVLMLAAAGIALVAARKTTR
ncbi:hypothetical protein [Bifidobacterium sp. UBA6881]|uniref:hypothetical protein n=1 Tax=Bifidobacterium sp. UBA6881 TaxID=1946109 RepID=UPI000EC5C09B|nr:hypothetical protein [Bifidobacterium sp. UBA6881]HAH52914.1 hypothetical protein [Bifidobacterium sp.]HCA73600.1 hypothetical protein [Bifidobacterium sp.]